MPTTGRVVMSTSYEGYRRKLAVRTAEGDAVTLIVTCLLYTSDAADE